MNTVQRYFKTRARYELIVQQSGATDGAATIFKQSLDKALSRLPEWLTQEVLDSMWTGRLKSDLTNEVIGESVVWCVDRCYGCVNWSDDESHNGCKVYNELLYVCDRYEERLDV